MANSILITIREFACEPCQDEFDTFKGLARHLTGRSHRKRPKANTFSCQTCKESPGNADDLKRHLTKKSHHMRSRTHRHFLDLVKSGLEEDEVHKHLLLAEIKRKDSKGKKIQPDILALLDSGKVDFGLDGKCLCRPCRCLFHSASELVAHLTFESVHKATRLACGDCKYSSAWRGGLLKHLRSKSNHMRIRKQVATDSTSGGESAESSDSESLPTLEPGGEGDHSDVDMSDMGSDSDSESDQMMPRTQGGEPKSKDTNIPEVDIYLTYGNLLHRR